MFEVFRLRSHNLPSRRLKNNFVEDEALFQEVELPYELIVSFLGIE
jgi:hypothetical protein